MPFVALSRAAPAPGIRIRADFLSHAVIADPNCIARLDLAQGNGSGVWKKAARLSGPGRVIQGGIVRIRFLNASVGRKVLKVGFFFWETVVFGGDCLLSGRVFSLYADLQPGIAGCLVRKL